MAICVSTLPKSKSIRPLLVSTVPDQSWGVRFPRYDVSLLEPPLRYPSQLFEVALGLLVMAGLFLADRWLGKEKRPRGALIAVFFVLYFIGRFTVEFFKEFQTTLDETSPLTMGQDLSIPGFLLGLVGLAWALKRKDPAGWPRQEADEDEGDDEDEDEDEEEGDEGEEEAPRGKLYDPDVEEELNASKRGARAEDE